MSPTQFAFLADENIHPEVIRYLRGRGAEVTTVQELRLNGSPDTVVLRAATDAGWVVLTHDRDFGALAVSAGQSIVGILYLRPGHIDPNFTIETLTALFRTKLNPAPPFIVVAVRSGDSVRVRLRKL